MILSWLSRPRFNFWSGSRSCWDKSRTWRGYYYASLGDSTVGTNQDRYRLVLRCWDQLFETVNSFSSFKTDFKIYVGLDFSLDQNHVEANRDLERLLLCKPWELNGWDQPRSRSISSLATSRQCFWNWHFFLNCWTVKILFLILVSIVVKTNWDPKA